jgi:hypothetical protein
MIPEKGFGRQERINGQKDSLLQEQDKSNCYNYCPFRIVSKGEEYLFQDNTQQPVAALIRVRRARNAASAIVDKSTPYAPSM